MGQAGTKPPIRMVLPDDDSAIINMVDGSGEETENATDMLGVIAEEGDYPDPAPPVQKQKYDGNEADITVDRNVESIEENDDIGGKINNKLEDFIQVELVPVGASFKNYSKKKQNDVAFEDDNLSIIQNELTKGMKSTTTRTVTVATSTPYKDSGFNTSRTNESDYGLDNSKTMKRELMLTEREKYEYRKLHAPPTSNVLPRGQVRRWTFDMPQPHSAVGSLENFRNVEDRIAEELAERHKDHRAESYSELVKDLNMHLKSERLKVKVILAWINKQNIGRLTFGPRLPSPDTPNGYMMLIQENQGTFPVFFALLCRAARLKCAIVSGISKGSKYEVGSKSTEGLNNTWNAVLVDGSWQLVHPLWACKGTANRQAGGWLKIEEEGKATRSMSIASSGRDIYSFNPYFIFTKPEEFIIRNFPDEQKWQLLPNPLTIDDFMEQMYIRPIFFINKFKLLSENKSKLLSEHGEPCEIKIAFPKRKSHDVVFGYELSIKVERTKTDADENSALINVEDMDEVEASKDINEETERYVMVKKSENEVIFEVRFFKVGVYKLRLHGGYYSEFGTKPPWILDILLECSSVVPKPQPLPFEPGTVGWGPGPISESLGLYVPSLTEGSFPIAELEMASLYFVLKEEVFVKSELHHNKISAEQLNDFVETTIVEQENFLTVHILVKCPGPGDYGLKILVLKNGTLVNACNYMVQTRKKRPHESYYVRNSKDRVFESMEKCDIASLANAIAECDKHDVPKNDPVVIGGRNMLEFLLCKKELHIALLVNRIDVVEHALYRTRTANLDTLLGKECARVEEHLANILKLDAEGWTCEIPEIDRVSIVELSHLRKPKLEIRLVVVAMYMLLGVEEELLKDWNKVRRYLRDQQSTLVEIARLEKYIALKTTSNVIVEKPVVDRVQEILINYTEEDIRRVDNTAAAYYQWVIGVTHKLKQKINEEESRLQLLKDLETVTPKVSSARVNGSAFHSRKGFKPALVPVGESTLTNPSINGHIIGRTNTKLSNRNPKGADQTSMFSSRIINGSNTNLQVPLTQKDAKRASIVGTLSRKQSIRDTAHADKREGTHELLNVNGVSVRPSNVQSRRSAKPAGTSVNAPSRLSKNATTTPVNDPSMLSVKATPVPVNRDGISGNTFFSEGRSSANKKRP